MLKFISKMTHASVSESVIRPIHTNNLWVWDMFEMDSLRADSFIHKSDSTDNNVHCSVQLAQRKMLPFLWTRRHRGRGFSFNKSISSINENIGSHINLSLSGTASIIQESGFSKSPKTYNTFPKISNFCWQTWPDTLPSGCSLIQEQLPNRIM